MDELPADPALPGFEALVVRWRLRPIRNCPGRFVIEDAPPTLAPADVLGASVPLRTFYPAAARDAVAVARFPGGGLISYLRGDGTYLHTLNTPEGLDRKLAQLGIAPDGE